jgi:predicted aspartyl protease
VTLRFAYDAELDPPAPVVPVRVGQPAGGDSVMVPMLVDTSADCTLIPTSIVERLGLPLVDVIGVTGVGGATTRAAVHAAVLELGALQVVARVVAFASEAILGRDVLNQVCMTLDGPGLALSLARRSRPSRRRPGPATPRARSR